MKWYEKLSSFIITQCYKKSTSNNSLLILYNGTLFTTLLVYVDDVILAGNSLEKIERIKSTLDHEFNIKDLGKLKYFQGIEVANSKIGINICQIKYCLDILKDINLLGYKTVKTPLDPCVKLHIDSSAPYEYILFYMRLVGKLLYLITTKRDINFTTQQLSQFLSTPTITHYDISFRVVKYLKGSPGKGLIFIRDSNLQLLGFIDAD